MAVAFALVSSPVRADLVLADDQVVHGAVRSIAGGVLTIEKGCVQHRKLEIPIGQVRLVEFSPMCRGADPAPPTSGLQTCETARRQVWAVRFRDAQAPVYAQQLELKRGGDMVATLAGGQGAFVGPSSRLLRIASASVCPTDLASVPPTPLDLCFDRVQWAVNWSAEPAYNNRIFTRGASVFVETFGTGAATAPQDPPVEGLVREAMGNAMTIWTSALQDHPHLLDDAMKAFLQSRLSCSPAGTCLLTPPQVVERSCPQAAHFIVRVFKDPGSDAFAANESSVLAKAQVEGRTIAINAAAHRFVQDLSMDSLSRDSRVNLITVMVHELGHAFGLRHSSGPSVMNPGELTRYPTERDARAFVAILKRSIVGARPGELDPTRCEGLSLPQADRAAP